MSNKIEDKTYNNRVRKLDIKEVGLIKRSWDQNVIARYTIHCKVDIFESENLKLMKKAILKVMQSEEYLSACIVKTGDKDYFYERIDFDKYNFENVKFLRLKNFIESSDEIKRVISDLLFDDCFSKEINPDKQDKKLLWKWFIFEIDKTQNYYSIIAQFHHSAVQGKVVLMKISKIMKTFEMLHKNQIFELKYEAIFPNTEIVRV